MIGAFKPLREIIVLILDYRYSVKQPLVEISCQEIHIFIACLIHQIEQAGLNRLTVVFLSHLILLLFQDNEYPEAFGVILQTSEIAIGLSQIRTNHFRTNIQPQFVSVFHCITNTSLQVGYANMETGYFCFHNAKLQILLLPIQFYRKRFRNLYFPFIGDGNAKKLVEQLSKADDKPRHCIDTQYL